MSDVRVRAYELRVLVASILSQSIPKEEAQIVASSLVDADLCGVTTHGVSRVADYLKRMDAGLVETQSNVTLVRETTTTALYDTGNGWGQVASQHAMEAAIKKALKFGTGFVGVRNSNHNGMGAYWTTMAAENGCIGIAMTNTSASMVPFGATEPSLGTNPLSIAIPSGKGRRPVVLDMATSNVARGKIILARKKGESIPEGWAITKDGQATTDPVAAMEGFMLPMGAKGSGLAIVVDILSGVLTGALFGRAIPRMYEDPEPQGLGHFFGAIQIEAFMDKETFFSRMDQKIEETVTSKPAAGFDRVYMPGEIELIKKEKQDREGVHLPHQILDELRQTVLRYGLDWNAYITSVEEG